MLYGPVPNVDQSNMIDQIKRSITLFNAIRNINPSDLLLKRRVQKDADLVTVIVPMFNASKFIALCLKSIFLQSYPNIEVFCVDDHSEDDTYSKVIDLFGKDTRLCVIRLAQNVGCYQIKNWVISELSDKKLVALQDADDFSHPNRIAIQRQWLIESGTRICGTCVHHFFPSRIPPTFGTDFSLKDEQGEYEHSLGIYDSVELSREPLDLSQILGNLRKDYITKHGSLMFERNLLKEFGGFDGHTKIGADTELMWRLLRFEKIDNIPKILYFRQFHDNSLTRDPDTGLNSEKRRVYTERRDRKHEHIRWELEKNNIDAVRSLCTSDLYYDDIEIEEIYSNCVL